MTRRQELRPADLRPIPGTNADSGEAEASARLPRRSA